MLTRRTGKARRLRFLTYDLEWYPRTFEERLVGVFDGKAYRHYSTTLEFLRNELNSANRGSVFFAHAGGLADVQFVFREFIKRQNPSYRLNAIFSGSSAIIVKIRQGKNTWTFCDSFWLLRDSLAKIGSSLGLEKGGKDYQCSSWPNCGHASAEGKALCIFYAPMPLLRDYNALDCRILWTAIARLQDEILQLGGELRPTIASTALMLFRSSFLERDIPTDPEQNAILRDAYIASRVEVFKRDCGRADYYDINSSFPASMTKPQPGRFLRSSTIYTEGELCMVRARVTVPDCNLPPLPVRIGQRVFFPVGTFEKWFTSADLELLLETGGRIEHVSEVWHYEPFSDLANYVSVIYEMRRREKDPFLKLLYKYLLNSLYGKFGEGSEKQKLVANPRKRPPGARPTSWPNVYLLDETVEVAHAHVPISATITAMSRALLARGMLDCEKGGGRVYYCDTDSITTTATLPTSDALGALKHEYEIQRGTFLAPKLYKILAKEPGESEAKWKIKAKGFPRLTSDQFDELAKGSAVELTRMIRIRENMRLGIIDPREEDVLKRTLSHLTPSEAQALGLNESRLLRPKRCIESDGNSRPWHVSELD